MSTSDTIIRFRLPEPWHAGVPVGSADVLPSLAAARWPDRTALLDRAGPITFAELDRRISRLASGIRELLGGDGSVVAVSAVPSPDFAIAYYAVLRSGNVVAPIHPRLGAAALDRLLVAVRARAVVLARATYELARAALSRLGGLEQVFVFEAPANRPGPPTCGQLAGRGDLLVEPRDRDEREPAVITSGPSDVRSHQSVKLAAARTGLSGRAVPLDASAAYDHDQLNAAVWAGVTQLFGADPTVRRQVVAS